jgi:acetyltransferase-like isoleucine patch superfamily enzyme
MSAEPSENPEKPKEKNRIDVDPQTSKHKGLVGVYEVLLRRFKSLTVMITMLPVYGIGVFLMGVSFFPGFLLLSSLYDWTASVPWVFRCLILSFGLATSFYLYGFTLITFVPWVNACLRYKAKTWRGTYHSAEVVKWGIHNALTYLVRLTFLEFITPTPFNIWFYQRMGMKIGKGVQINSSNISDPALITLEDKVTIGGSATIIGHYGMAGFLVISPVVIRKGATIGLKATIMGGVEIGENATVIANSVVLPKTIIPAGEVWGGVPAVKLK